MKYGECRDCGYGLERKALSRETLYLVCQKCGNYREVERMSLMEFLKDGNG